MFDFWDLDEIFESLKKYYLPKYMYNAQELVFDNSL